MAAAEIDPLALGQLLAETGLHGIQGAFQRVGALFAQGMEMQAGDAFRQRFGQLVRPDAQTGARGAGIVDGHGAFGMFGIYAQAAADLAAVVPAPGPDLGAEAFPLGQGVEDQVIHQRQQLVQLFFRPARGKGVHFAAEFFAAQAGFIHGAGAGAPQGAVAFGAGEQGKAVPGGKALEGQQDLGAGALLHAVQNGRIGRQTGFVQHEAGRGDGTGIQQGQEMLHVSVFCRGWGEEGAAVRELPQGRGSFPGPERNGGRSPRAPSP